MTEFLGQPFPENQAEFCLMCMDRQDADCPCSSWMKLPESERFPLDDAGLEEYLVQKRKQKEVTT